MKIPFTLEAWLKDKSKKVETRDGRRVHNIWRVKEPTYKNNRKTEVCALIDGEEDALVFFEGGRYLPTTKDTDSPFDLFIVTPEPELSKFEKRFLERVFHQTAKDLDEQNKEIFLEDARYVLAIARKELFANDAVLREYAEVSREQGKAEALKDLPRWKPAARAYDGDKLPRIDWSLNRLVARFEEGIFYLDIKELYKLPGFKEDESHE